MGGKLSALVGGGKAQVYSMDKQQVGKLAVLQERMRQLWIRHVGVSNELKEVGADLVDCLASIEEAQFIEGTYVVGWA